MDGNLAYQCFQDELWEELIDGEIVAMSPRPSVNHHQITINLTNIFSPFLKGKKCRYFSDGVDLYLTEKDRYIPDGMIVCDRNKVKGNGVYGAPDLVIEVLSPSTANYDRKRKMKIYEKCGVKEYWIISSLERAVEQHFLKDGKLTLNMVYTLEPDYMLEAMTEEERAAVVTEFKCSLYDDLIISLEDIFDDLI